MNDQPTQAQATPTGDDGSSTTVKATEPPTHRTGGILADQIQAGAIEDADGSLARMTDDLVRDLRAANRLGAAAPETPPYPPAADGRRLVAAPPGETRKLPNAFGVVVDRKRTVHFALLALTPDERREVMAQFCNHCGSDDPRCQCWRDE